MCVWGRHCHRHQALYEGVLLERAALAPFFAAALLGAPLTLDDLPALDAELHRSLLQLKRMPPGDVEALCLDFSVGVDTLGRVEARELLPGGADVAVTAENRLAYVAAVARHAARTYTYTYRVYAAG